MPPKRDQPEARRRPRRHPDDRAAEPGDELGHRDDVAHAQPTTWNGSQSSPSGATITATTAAGITTAPIAGTASRLASSPYCATALKWKAEIGAVAEPRDQRGHRDAEHRLREAPALRGLGLLPPAPAAQRLVDRDQRHRRRERHLEARLRQALGRHHQHDQRRERDRAHASAPAGRAAPRRARSRSSRRSAAPAPRRPRSRR